MRCKKCGAEWNEKKTFDIQKCPFCKEILSEDIPYKQVVDSFRMLIERFGCDIYLEEQRLDAMVNDLVPNILKEKNIIRSAISFNIPSMILNAYKNPQQRNDILKDARRSIEVSGINKEWSSAILFMFSYPLEVDSREIFPLDKENEKSQVKFKKKMFSKSVTKKLEKNYDTTLNEVLENLSEDGNVEASLELGSRYYFGNGVEQDYSKAIRYYRRAEIHDDPMAQYSLGVMYTNALGVNQDDNRAFEYYRKSAEQGVGPAMFSLGEMYYYGQGCEKNDQQAVYWVQKAEKEYKDSNIYITLALILKDSKDDAVRDLDRAFEYIQKAVNMGSEIAFNLMGIFYENGIGIEQDYKKAFKYYSLAAEKGMEDAYINMGAFYQLGYGVEQDYKKAVECFQLGADIGNMYCLNALAMCYKNGQGVEQDYKKAFDLFLESAYAGNYAAEFNVGLAYAEEQGVAQDLREAKKWFLLSAKQGFGKAMAMLGLYAERGIPDGNSDLEEAFDWYLKSANTGDYALSQWILGNCRTYGLMDSYVDELEGFEWYLKAAHNGHPTAQNNMAVAYMEGILVDQDYDLAVKWFEKAVAQDEPIALNNYGMMLINGNGVNRDVLRGFEMLKRAAELGNHDAKVNLGICYFESWGTSRNLDAALQWLSEAYFESEDETARVYLEKGFKQKHGSWVKRGFLGRVPEPELLPPVKPIQIAKNGCSDGCICYESDESDTENHRIYCRYFQKEVFNKRKCPYYL